ncbi:MAG: tetraacyldisaccharide 4'-kinase [Desulfoarculaceae bacterium]|nr:tetraacyldisaccharide 4'-kinase [Desulfoarculaceae bacterium]
MSDSKRNLYFLGRPFSPLYSAAMKLRSFLYSQKVFRQYKMEVPVISVGNLTMGGTGKTPIVSYLATFLQSQGYRPAIISRGYGGAVDNKVNVVSDGKELYLDAGQAGDEPRLLAETLPGVPVLTGIVRALPCNYAIDTLGCDILLLDDGFQHLAVDRNINLVLFSAESLAGNSRVFPGGDLREPVSALMRGDAFLLTGTTAGNKERANRFAALLQSRWPHKPVFFSSYTAAAAKNEKEDKTLPLTALPTPLFGFCGIARPEAFRQSLIEQGISLGGFTGLRDHQPYTPRLLRQLQKEALASGAKGIITTAKDMVKLKDHTFPLPIFSLQMLTHIDDGLKSFILERLKPLQHTSQ